MLAYALEHNRVFCVSTRLPDASEEDDDAVFPYSTAGLVRACVRSNDGTSNLILQGIQRVRFGDWLQKEPFRIVEMEPVPTSNPDPDYANALRKQLIEAMARHESGTEGLLQQLEDLEAPDVFADVMAFHVITDPYARQPMLEMENVSNRLEFLLKVFASV